MAIPAARLWLPNTTPPQPLLESDIFRESTLCARPGKRTFASTSMHEANTNYIRDQRVFKGGLF